MRIVIIIVRILLGALMVFASIAYFFKIGEQPVPTGEMATVMGGIAAMKYMMPLVKVIELIAGLSLLTGKFIKVALLVLLPVSINIFLLLAFLAPSELVIGGFVFAANLFLIYANWSSYKHLFAA
jgi:putative oxidoreductase